MKRTPRLCAALVAALSAGAALAGVEDTVWNAQKERARALKPANAKRLRAAEGAGGDGGGGLDETADGGGDRRSVL